MNLNNFLRSNFSRNLLSFLFLLGIFCSFSSKIRAAEAGEPRKQINLDAGWFFSSNDQPNGAQKDLDVLHWQEVDLPHTWNASDTFDDAPGYRTGTGWYRKELNLSKDLYGKKLFLHFEAVGQKAEVFINDKSVCSHQGGYTAFTCEITDYLQDDWTKPQIIAVRADNNTDPNLAPPPSADFNMYGGIYRDVKLIAVEPIHFSLNDYASSGIYFDTPKVSSEKAVVRIRGIITNDLDKSNNLRVVSTISDDRGQIVTKIESVLAVAGLDDGKFEQKGSINNPKLWSPETPYLYHLKTELYRDGKLIDEVTNQLGVRWFSFDPNKGFFLNGKPYKLRGSNRHQDYPAIGNALSDKLHETDLKIIKDSGFNMVLLPHYPQAQAVLEAADRLGLFVWAELPLVRQISTSEKYAQNSKEMLRELIRQQYNHPSIIIWCYMNEIFLRPLNESGYVLKTVQLAQQLEDIARNEDTFRYTAISANRPYDGSDVYHASGLLKIPRIVAWHMYFGWYYGDFKDLGLFLDAQHQRFPTQNIFVSEYGADYDIRLHSLTPSIGDGTAEWACAFHESYLEQIESKTYLAGSGVWAQFEFGSETRGDSYPHLNTKGIYTFDRQPKDIAFLYKAYFSKEPVLHVAATDWQNRRAKSNANNQTNKMADYPITVYTNLSEVELFVNRQSAGVKNPDSSKKSVWNVTLTDGLNEIEARGKFNGKDIFHRTQINLIIRPEPLTSDFLHKYGLLINVGSNTQFISDDENVWESDRPYQVGGWGFVGGKQSKISQNIINTADDPLYQTFRQGLSAYRFDIPDGDYEIEMFFAEPSDLKKGERIFDISANGIKVIENFDLISETGLLQANIKKFKIKVSGGKGLSLDFQSAKGDTILCAISLHLLPPK